MKIFRFLCRKPKSDTDGPQIVKISKHSLKEIYPIYVRYRQSANLKSSIPEVKKYLKSEYAKHTDFILAAKDGNTVMGFLHYCYERSTLRPAQRITLKALFVAPEYRGHGIAKNLIRNLQQNLTVSEIRVKARCSNECSPNLYISNGFYEDKEYVHLVYRKK